MWLKATYPDAIYLDLLESDLYFDLLARPQRLEELIPEGAHQLVIIDEVQKIPKLLDEVHRLIERDRHTFILTGSSSRSLKRKGVNLLAGRALTYRMHPLTAIELGQDFDMGQALRFGLLPAIFSEPDPERYLAVYVETYLREEVLQEGLTRYLAAFARFLEAASFSQGSVINVSEVAREAKADRKVVEGYFSIVEDLLIAHRVPVFTKRAKRRLIAHPKFYFFDVGVFRAIRPMGPLDAPEEAEGPALETLLLQHLLAINDYLYLGYEIYYWRTSSQLDVDFVLYGPKGLIACEVKRSDRIGSKDLAGLKAFGSDYPEATLYMFYGGSRRETHDRIQVLPLGEALKDLCSLLDSRG